MKVITYKDYGGYFVPTLIIEKYYDLHDFYEIVEFSDKALLIERHDVKLVSLFEKYAYKGSPFKINEIPDNSYYKIFNYDGAETLFYSESPIYEVE